MFHIADNHMLNTAKHLFANNLMIYQVASESRGTVDLYNSYTISLLIRHSLSMFANCWSQFLLDRLGRCLKLSVSTDSTSCHEFASQFGLAFVYTRNTTKYDRADRPSRKCLLNEKGVTPVTVDRSPATNRGGNNNERLNMVIAATY